MLTMKEHLDFRTLSECPICNRSYNEHWKVVCHIRKSCEPEHKIFLEKQEQQLLELYKSGSRCSLHSRLSQSNNIFAGISFANLTPILHRIYSPEELEQERVRRISETLSKVPKSKEHNKKVSISVKKAWENGTFDTPEIVKARQRGYDNRRSCDGQNNPMYGKPCPRGAGRGKGGIRSDLGHYVRSTWEANVCRICRIIGREYEYEKHRFTVCIDDKFYTYAPDLYFPDKKFYYEIKGHARSARKWECTCKHCVRCRKVIDILRKTHKIKIYLIGRREYLLLKRIFISSIQNWE